MPHAYVTGFDGVSYDFFNPDHVEIDPHHVAKSLARKHRYNGFLDIPLDETYGVGQHSLYVSKRCGEIAKKRMPGIDDESLARIMMIGLAHDTPEFILTDVVTPFKKCLPDYQAFEAIWEPAMYAWAGVANPTAVEMEIMKEADHDVLLMEMKQFGRSHRDMTDEIVPIHTAYDFPGRNLKPSEAYEAFMDTWDFLRERLP